MCLVCREAKSKGVEVGILDRDLMHVTSMQKSGDGIYR